MGNYRTPFEEFFCTEPEIAKKERGDFRNFKANEHYNALRTELIESCRFKLLDVKHFFVTVKKGVDFDLKQHIAPCEEEGYTYLRLIVDIGCDPSSTEEVVEGSLEIAKSLLSLKKPAKPYLFHIRSAFACAVRASNQTFIQLLLPYMTPKLLALKGTNTPLWEETSYLQIAVFNGDFDNVKLLVSKGGMIFDDISLGAAAIIAGRLDILIYLLQQGALINEEKISPKFPHYNLLTEVIRINCTPMTMGAIRLFKLLRPLTGYHLLQEAIDARMPTIHKYTGGDEETIAEMKAGRAIISQYINEPNTKIDINNEREIYLQLMKQEIQPFLEFIRIMLLANYLRGKAPNDHRLFENIPKKNYQALPLMAVEVYYLVSSYILPYLQDGKIIYQAPFSAKPLASFCPKTHKAICYEPKKDDPKLATAPEI